MSVAGLFTNYSFQIIAIGAMLLGLMSGVLGTLAVLNKQALIGDGISHAALPGLVLAFMITGTKNPFYMLLGALLSGLLSICLVMLVVRFTKVKFDAALAIMLSVFFGLGLVLKTLLQKQSNARQAGLDSFLYGQASSLLRQDVEIMAIASLVAFLLVMVFWRQIKVSMFDREFALSIGIPTAFINGLVTLLIGIAIIIGIQSVGVVLMSAMLIAPAVAARQWTSRYWLMMLLSALFGLLSGFAGTLLSVLDAGLPTGASIVLIISVIAIFSLLFAPERGIVSRSIRRSKAQKALKEGNYVPS